MTNLSKKMLFGSGSVANIRCSILLSFTISFKYMINQQLRFHTSGNGNTKEIIYRIFGRETADSLIEVKQDTKDLNIHGYIGNPLMNRASRNGENYFVNMRYVKSELIAKAK